jgi:hypothetical protein
VGGRALPIAANRTGGSFVLSRAQGGELCRGVPADVDQGWVQPARLDWTLARVHPAHPRPLL